jgi:hypothetical protein
MCFERRYQYMLRRFLSLVVLTTVTPTLSAAMPGAVRKAAQGQASVVWKSEITKDKYGNPHGKLFLLVGRRKKLILPKASAECMELPRAHYKLYDVPATAITACRSWWAGQGEYLYVLRRGKQLVIFLREEDEGTPVKAYKQLPIVISLP